MVKAIARAFRWREMLENGTHATIAEIAAVEKINESYVGRILRLTPLAPDNVESHFVWSAVGRHQYGHLDAGIPGGLACPTRCPELITNGPRPDQGHLRRRS
jgi:hypothetical protein